MYSHRRIIFRIASREFSIRLFWVANCEVKSAAGGTSTYSSPGMQVSKECCHRNAIHRQSRCADLYRSLGDKGPALKKSAVRYTPIRDCSLRFRPGQIHLIVPINTPPLEVRVYQFIDLLPKYVITLGGKVHSIPGPSQSAVRRFERQILTCRIYLDHRIFQLLRGHCTDRSLRASTSFHLVSASDPRRLGGQRHDT